MWGDIPRVFIFVNPVVDPVPHPRPCREQHLALAPVSEDAKFPETRPRQWFPPDSNSFRKLACCRRPELLAESVGPASVARRRCPGPALFGHPSLQENGNCGTVWLERRAHLAARGRSCRAEIAPERDRRSMRSCAGSTAYSQPGG